MTDSDKLSTIRNKLRRLKVLWYMPLSSFEEESIVEQGYWGLYYKTFYGRNLY
jgi:hypothetical protein